MLFPIVLREGNKRGLINFLEENGIETRDLLPLLNQPIYRSIFGDLEPQYPVAEWLNRCGFYIGCHQHIDTPRSAASRILRLRARDDRSTSALSKSADGRRAARGQGFCHATGFA